MGFLLPLVVGAGNVQAFLNRVGCLVENMSKKNLRYSFSKVFSSQRPGFPAPFGGHKKLFSRTAISMGGMVIGRVTSPHDDAGPKMPRAPIANSARKKRDISPPIILRYNYINVL